MASTKDSKKKKKASTKDSKKKKKASTKDSTKNEVGAPLKFPDLDELKDRIIAYFESCDPHIEFVKRPVTDKDGNFKMNGEEFLYIMAPFLTDQRPYTISGLAYFLDTSRETLLDYERLAELDSDQLPLKLRSKDPAILREYSYTIKRAKARCEAYVESHLLTSRNPVGAIFNLKNNYRNWKDSSEVTNPEEAENRKAIEELRTTLRKRTEALKKGPS